MAPTPLFTLLEHGVLSRHGLFNALWIRSFIPFRQSRRWAAPTGYGAKESQVGGPVWGIWMIDVGVSVLEIAWDIGLRLGWGRLDDLRLEWGMSSWGLQQ